MLSISKKISVSKADRHLKNLILVRIAGKDEKRKISFFKFYRIAMYYASFERPYKTDKCCI